MRTETGHWLRHAKEDLVTARVTLEGKRWAATSFHAQQAAEKALKALWLERKGLEPPRTHDLVRLAQETGAPDDWLEEVDALSRVYLLSRYPGASMADQPPTSIDRRVAAVHVAVAERILSWTEQQLSTESSSG
jgi:HEPN domain-containing protein